MREEIGVDIIEHAGAHQECLAAQLLFGHPRPEHDGAGQLLARHDVLHGKGREDVERNAAVVSLTMPRCTGHDPVARCGRGLLAGLRNAIDVGTECNDRRATAPTSDPRGGDAGHTALHGETILLEHTGQVFRCLHLLHAELTKGEHLVHHGLSELCPCIDIPGDLGLEPIQTGGRGHLGAEDERNQQSGCEESCDNTHDVGCSGD